MPEPDAIDMESGADTSGSSLSFGGMTEFLARSGMADRDTLPPGTRLGEVVIIRLVGVGGMGRVYEGLQGMPCRTVAVKVMRPGALSPAVAKRFEHRPTSWVGSRTRVSPGSIPSGWSTSPVGRCPTS